MKWGRISSSNPESAGCSDCLFPGKIYGKDGTFGVTAILLSSFLRRYKKAIACPVVIKVFRARHAVDLLTVVQRLNGWFATRNKHNQSSQRNLPE